MKFSIKLFYGLMIFLACTISSCGEDPVVTPDPSQTIVDVASNDARFSSLVAALDKAGLVSALQGDDALTVFAPTNDAFDQLFMDLGVAGLDDLSADDLQPILLYHVVSGAVTSDQLTTSYVKTLSTDSPDDLALDLFINTAAGVVLNANSTVTEADISADNGVIHVINKVLLPPSVVDIAMQNSDFSLLVESVVAADLASTLSGDGPFTVFAPTNAAFEQLLIALNLNSIEDIPLGTLTDALLYHVVGGNVSSSELSNGDVSTLSEGNSLNINLQNGVVINNDTNVIAADVQGTNGIIHVIDKVLLP